LAALVDQSMVRSEAGLDGAARFIMLETIREYAVGQLAMSAAAALHQRHAAYYLALAERAEPQLHGAEQARWLDRLEAEHDNMRAALAWSQTVAERRANGAPAAADLGLRLASALGWFWYMRGYWSEGHAWLAGALARGGAAPALVRATAHTWLGELEQWYGDHGTATAPQHFEASLAIGRAVGDKPTIATALRDVGMSMLFGTLGSQRDIAGIAALLEESLTLFREIGDGWNLGIGLQCLGALSEQQHDYGRAAALLDESLTIFRRLHDRWHMTLSLLLLGKLARYQGDYARAEPFYDECCMLAEELHARSIQGDALIQLGNLARYQAVYDRAAACYDAGLALLHEVGNQGQIASVMQDQGYLAHQRGDQARATVLLNASLARCRELVDPRLSVWCLAGLGRVAVAQGQPERAAQLFGTTAALFEVFDPHMDPTDRADYERAVALTRAQLDAATFAAAWAAGRAITLEQAIAAALDEVE
jgi:tetratricopeptide (TPR) repeat protein